ncbi:MAG: GTP cyclohydrolase II [Pseudomonadota bacterium]
MTQALRASPSKQSDQATPGLTDEALLRRVARALAELRRGAPLLLHDGAAAALMQTVEGSTSWALAKLARLAGRQPVLLVTKSRAAALGLKRTGSGPVAVELSAEDPAQVGPLADPTLPQPEAWQVQALPSAAFPAKLTVAAVDLVKQARLLPAVLFVPLGPERRRLVEGEDLLSLSAATVYDYRQAGSRTLTEVTAARVPLAGAENTRIHAFRPGDGGLEHLAIVIGDLDPAKPVLVRLHSECFTGDLLGSLRCDCGDQLRGAVDTISAEGSGVLLYLAQEGRGIGLVNKLRAYRLQDQGADTLEANQQLGFDADERVYLPAAEMLRLLGLRQVRLLTNNPEKVAGLQNCGIEVTERVVHSFPDNEHNRPYLITKARRFGHLF